MNVAAIFQNKVRFFLQLFSGVYTESVNLGSLYWKSDMQSVLGTIAMIDPATVSSKLTRNSITLSISLFEHIVGFGNSGTPAQADYLTNILDLMNGNVARSSVLSSATEDFGERAKSTATILNQMKILADDILSYYFANQISDVVAVLADYRPLFGATAQKEEIVEAMVVVEQFKKMMNNEVYTTGNYYGVTQEWTAFAQLPES